jgi:LPXTG-motif cell wall-anchored protein
VHLRRRLAVLLVPAAILLAAPTAHAAGGIDVDVPGGGLQLERLAPGYGGSAEVRISNGSSHDADVTLRVQDLADDENGCIRPEVRDGDVTCDTAGGELSSWLRVTVEDDDGTQLWQGPMRDLEDAGALVAEGMPAGTDLPLTVRVELPFEAGNDTMTDRVDFALRVDASADLDTDTEVLGVEAAAGGKGDGDEDVAGVAGLLPFTGSDVAPWVPLVGAFLVGAGGYLVVSRRRRDPAAA